MIVQNLLENLSEIEIQMRALTEARAGVLAELEAAVPPGDTVTFAGFKAQWKPGRKATDHEAAAQDMAVDAAIIEKHTAVKTTVAWAKVTKDAKVPKAVLDQYTTEAPPSFVVEPIK